MRIIFEEHQYNLSDIGDNLKGLSELQDVEKKVSVGYVGYFYNPTVKDCVFILPKVLLSDCKGSDIVADVKYKDKDGVEHNIRPEDIINPEGQEKYLSAEYRKFIYEFAVWIYRALCVYRNLNPQSKAVYYRQLPQEGHGKRHQANTYLDIILSMMRFNNENQNYFMFTLKNLHSGQNKINWTKTISKSNAVIQEGNAVYINPINKKRTINFDEELFVIFFSILNHLNEQYGFKAPINYQYELIKGKRFQTYINGFGKTKLRQIKYKYFADKALHMWDMCYAFFDATHKLAINTEQKEYLLAKSFEHVFEAMIDELLGDKDIPKGLKEQADGKRIDHLYTYEALTISNDQRDEIYYIGDSKYYKSGHRLGYESIYKQYTYARNVIQWNINLFLNNAPDDWNDEEKKDWEDDRMRYKNIRLRDDSKDSLTEGYNVIPNFFISAFVYPDHRYVANENIFNHKGKNTHIQYQFEDRLFDRDTLILSHYDVNFLYVIYLYARNKNGEKALWRQKTRELFRDKIRTVLQEKYDFYAMKGFGNPFAGEQVIREHFKELQGKLYRPYSDRNLYALALEKKEGLDSTKSDVYKLLENHFIISKVNLGDNPREELEKEVDKYQKQHPYIATPSRWLPEYHVERYLDRYFVVGMYHDKEHWDWITGKNDRGSLIYNVRLDKKRHGAQTKSRIRAMRPLFAIIYEEDKPEDYHVFKIHDFAEMSEERMRQAMYPTNHGGPNGDYFIFRFDEEVNIGRFNINALINFHRISDKESFVEGAPLYPTGKELMKYKQY